MPLTRNASRFVFAVVLATGLTASGAFAQNDPMGSDHGTLHFRTKIGSFKILGDVSRPAEGKVEMNFTGTVLVTGSPDIQVSGNVRQEYKNDDRKKQVFFGTGKLIINGKFQGIQWFGSDLNAVWTGWGVVRMYGEYDKNLNTGEFWYAEAPTEKREWGSHGNEARNPRPQRPAQMQPRRRVQQ